MISSRFLHRLPLMVAVLGSLCLAIYLGINEYKALQQELTTIEPIQAQTSTECADGKDNDGDGKNDMSDPGCTSSHLGTENDRMWLGMNMPSTDYWSTSLLFNDSMKYATADWAPVLGSTNFCTAATITDIPISARDANGWPKGITPAEEGRNVSRCVNMHLHAADWPEGTYNLLFDGEGTVHVKNSANGTWTFTSGQANNTFTVPPWNEYAGWALTVRITKSNPANYVRNIKIIQSKESGCVWPDGKSCYEAYRDDPSNPRNVFRPDFLDRLKPFSVLRFLDTQHTNHSEITSWNQLLPKTYFKQTSDLAGVSPEYMIDLCNVMKDYGSVAGCWFLMPHEANDDFVRQFATMVRDKLDPSITAYVEYSNEVWNWSFWQAQDVLAWGTASGRGHTKEWAYQASLDFAIWADVFKDQPQRLKRVAAAQHAYTGLSMGFFDELAKLTSFEVISTAPYYGHDCSATVYTSVSAIVGCIETALRPRLLTDLQEYRRKANELSVKFGKPVEHIAYEGGMHVMGYNNPAPEFDGPTGKNKPVYDYNKSADAGKHVRQYMQNAYEQGMHGFVYFNFMDSWSRGFAWSVLQSFRQNPATSTKYQALMDFLNAQKNNQNFDYIPPLIAVSPAVKADFTTSRISFGCNELCAASVRYRVKGTPVASSKIEVVSSTPALTHVYTIEGLTENTAYDYELLLSDPAGNLGTSVTYSFRTASTAAVLHLPFETLVGSKLADASTTKNDASIVGNVTLSTDVPTLLAGKSTQSLRVNGESTPSAYVKIPNHETLNPEAGFTMSFWAKRSKSFFESQLVVKYYMESGFAPQFGIVVEPDGKLRLDVTQKNRTIITLYSAANTLPVGGSWKHIAIIADPDLKLIKLFVNGVAVTEKAYNGTLNTTTSAMGIGAQFLPDGGVHAGRPFNGYMDDLRFYNRPLTTADITELAAGREPLLGAAGSSSSSRSSGSSSSSSSSTASLASACVTMTDPDNWNLHRNAPVSVTLKQGTSELFTVSATIDATGKVTYSHASLETLPTASTFSLLIKPRGYQQTTITSLSATQVLSTSCTSATIKFGDFNTDGSLTVADLLKMLQFLKNGSDTDVQAVFGSITARLVDLVKLIRMMNT